MPKITGLSGMRCDRPGCRHVEFLDDGQLPKGLSGTVHYVAETGGQPVSVEFYACKAPHLKDAVNAALQDALAQS